MDKNLSGESLSCPTVAVTVLPFLLENFSLENELLL